MNSRKIQWIRVQITTIISLALQGNGLQLRSSNDTASQQKYLIFLLKLCFVLVSSCIELGVHLYNEELSLQLNRVVHPV